MIQEEAYSYKAAAPAAAAVLASACLGTSSRIAIFCYLQKQSYKQVLVWAQWDRRKALYAERETYVDDSVYTQFCAVQCIVDWTYVREPNN